MHKQVMFFEVVKGNFSWEIRTTDNIEEGLTWDQAVALLAGAGCCNEEN